jgi:electron transport complex protein RnfG
MKETLRLIIATTLFCLGAGLLLAWTNAATKERIERNRRAELSAALKRVLPACDNDVAADARTVRIGETEWVFYVARRGGVFVGAACRSASQRGYGGAIEVLLGIRADGAVQGLEILRANETPGLGSRIAEPKFRDQYRNRSAFDTRWAAMRKDGGEIEAITGATISSRAVNEAVRAALDAFAAQAKDLAGAPDSVSPEALGGTP